MLELRCWGTFLAKVRCPRGACFPSYKLSLLSLSLHVMLPSWPIRALSPRTDTKSTLRAQTGGGGKLRGRSPASHCQPLLCSSPALWDGGLSSRESHGMKFKQC